MNNKEEFMKYAKQRLKEKEYKRRALKCELDSLNIRAIEKTSRKKIGQVTRR